MECILRKAKEADMPAVLDLIKELATYERAPQDVTVTLDELIKDGFGDKPLFEVILAERENDIIGMAFYFYSYSTWRGKCVYLEDIIVKERYRGQKVGKLLFEAVIMHSKAICAKRLQWQVLDWNSDAIGFYKKFGAKLDNSWLNGRLSDEQIQEFVPSEEIYIN
jgi:GNAT superfamily N-acetyltransferase